MTVPTTTKNLGKGHLLECVHRNSHLLLHMNPQNIWMNYSYAVSSLMVDMSCWLHTYNTKYTFSSLLHLFSTWPSLHVMTVTLGRLRYRHLSNQKPTAWQQGQNASLPNTHSEASTSNTWNLTFTLFFFLSGCQHVYSTTKLVVIDGKVPACQHKMPPDKPESEHSPLKEH